MHKHNLVYRIYLKSQKFFNMPTTDSTCNEEQNTITEPEETVLARTVDDSLASDNEEPKGKKAKRKEPKGKKAKLLA